MSSFDPLSPSQEPLNPYAPPLAEVGSAYPEFDAADDAAAETIRRRYLSHEAGVKSIGSLHYLGGFFGLIGVAGMIAFFVNSAQGGARPQIAVLLVVYFLMTAINLALGYGLRHLLTWARWTEAALLLIGSVVTLFGIIGLFAMGQPGPAVAYIFGLLLYAYLLYLLLSAKGTMVFSPGYKEIIEKTPHIKYRTSMIVKLAIGLFVALVVLAVIGALVGIQS